MDRLSLFNQYRSLLFAIAYRMLGSAADAEDMVQEAWIRWQATQTTVHSPKAFLSRLITRLCIDQLRSARVKRETYVGVWLPEPLVDNTNTVRQDPAELAESLSFAFLMLLECLSPTERAIFLLREVFDYDYAEIAEVVGKSVVNCRQIASRARRHLVWRKPGNPISLEQKEDVVAQFLASWKQGDIKRLVSLMAEDITFWADGGGQVTAAQRPLHGSYKVARFLMAIRRSPLVLPFSSHVVQINQQPGILNVVEDVPQSTFSFEFSDTSVQAIFAVVNPDKLKSVML